MPQYNRHHYEALISNFKNKANVQKALKRFDDLKDNDRILSNYLRYHKDEEINTDEEVEFRDDMDFLIGYYSVFMTAFICGYVGFESLQKFDTLDRTLLNHPAVRRYYEKNYPLILPILLRLSLNDPGFCDQMARIGNESKIGIREFEAFLSLYRSRLADEDINNLLFFLDDGYFYDNNLKLEIGINDFLFVLKNPDVYGLERFKRGRSAILDQIILGYSKYMNYLHAYKEVLINARHQPFQAAAIWSLDFYWFVRLNDKMGDVLRASLQNLRVAIDRQTSSPVEEQPDEELFKRWQDESLKALEQGIQDIDLLKRTEIGLPLIQLINSLYPADSPFPF